MSKKCQELVSGLLRIGSEGEGSDRGARVAFGGGGGGGDSVLGMPFVNWSFSPSLPLGPPLPALVVVALVYQTEYVSSPL